jgi:hypothetical protein
LWPWSALPGLRDRIASDNPSTPIPEKTTDHQRRNSRNLTSPNRLALVIGQAGYAGDQLPTAANDAAAVAIDQGYPNQSQHLTPVVLAVKSSGADIIGSYFTFSNDQAVFARQLRQQGVTLPWLGSPTTFLAETVKLGGPALWGTYGVADFAIDSSPEAKEFARLYGEVSKHRDLVHQGLQGRGGRIQLRRVRRRPSRMQHRAQREGHHRLRQAHRIHGLTDEHIRDAYLGGGEHGDEMTFGNRPLNVDSGPPLRA